jgi:hypothetical protein
MGRFDRLGVDAPVKSQQWFKAEPPLATICRHRDGDTG